MKQIIIITILITTALAPKISEATAQTAEIIYIDNEDYFLFSTPLEDYFDKDHLRPDTLGCCASSTALNRGYIGIWEISNDSLFLIHIDNFYNITIETEDERNMHISGIMELPLEIIFPGQSSPLFAGWYSDTLKIPLGKIRRYIHAGFASIYERDLFIEVKEGIVNNRWEVDNNNDDLFRSDWDVMMLSAEEHQKKFSDWVDLRLLNSIVGKRLRNSGGLFKTRGSIYSYNDTVFLRVHTTPQTDEIIHIIDSCPNIDFAVDNPLVEAEAYFEKSDVGIKLYVRSFRPLEYGETIYSPIYPMLHRLLDLQIDGFIRRIDEDRDAN